MYYVGNILCTPSDLKHYGIEGMKWGKRRWQNEDGSFTEEGKRRYFNSDGSFNDKMYRKDANGNIHRRGRFERSLRESYNYGRDSYNKSYGARSAAIRNIRGHVRAGILEQSRALGVAAVASIGTGVAVGLLKGKNGDMRGPMNAVIAGYTAAATILGVSRAAKFAASQAGTISEARKDKKNRK